MVGLYKVERNLLIASLHFDKVIFGQQKLRLAHFAWLGKEVDFGADLGDAPVAELVLAVGPTSEGRLKSVLGHEHFISLK